MKEIFVIKTAYIASKLELLVDSKHQTYNRWLESHAKDT